MGFDPVEETMVPVVTVVLCVALVTQCHIVLTLRTPSPGITLPPPSPPHPSSLPHHMVPVLSHPCVVLCVAAEQMHALATRPWDLGLSMSHQSTSSTACDASRSPECSAGLTCDQVTA